MNETLIHCPACGAEIPVSEVLGAQIREEMERDLAAENEHRLRDAVARAEAQAREGMDLQVRDLQQQVSENALRNEAAKQQALELRKQVRDMAAAQQDAEERLRRELDEQYALETKAKVDAELAKAEARSREQWQGQFDALRAELDERRKQLDLAQQTELLLRQQKQSLEERMRSLDLEVARKVDEEKGRIEAAVRQSAADESALKLREKEKQIDDLRQALADAKRRSELGSQELQGEVLELDIQVALEQQFPQDRIAPVLKGVRGADIVQWVRNERLDDCGAIVWETKNTRHWQATWLDKLKQDLRTAGGSLAVLISVALPDGIRGFGRIDGIWVSDIASWPALAVALRDQLVQVAFARAASQGKNEKMELLYQYLSGEEFRQRVESIVEAFEAMQLQIQKERRAMAKQWAEREKQIQRVIGSTSGMYGALQGIVGAGLPAIAALELDTDPPEEQS